jgi:tetratricopeptide (TPR) repeat protein
MDRACETAERGLTKKETTDRSVNSGEETTALKEKANGCKARSNPLTHILPVRAEVKMSADLQPEIEISPETNSDRVNDLSDEACRLHDVAVEAYRGGRPDKAEGLFRRALALFEQAEGPDVAATLGNLGAALEDRCDYVAAEECYVRAATITEAIEGDSENYEEDEDVARLRLQSLDNLGRIYHTQGCYAEAEPVIRRALDFAELAFGSESIEASGALKNLGMLDKFAGWIVATHSANLSGPRNLLY